MCGRGAHIIYFAKSLPSLEFPHIVWVAGPMSEDDFQLRIGRIRSRPSGGPRTFVGQALAAAQRAGGVLRRPTSRSGVFGRGRVASVQARTPAPFGRTRGAVVKARVVRAGLGRAPLAKHLQYLQREGVTQDRERGQLFDAHGDSADGARFAERCDGDRHHFRFIVSPDDAEQLSDLNAYTRDLMRQAEADLGTGLDWVAVDHWNTAHPHLHILVRGRTDAGQDLVISRDYIREGFRARAGQLVSLELGPRSDREVQRQLDAQVSADRWTALDRGFARRIDSEGLVDVRRSVERRDPVDAARIARLARLQRLGLAQEVRPGRWRLAPDAEPTLRALGQQQDIIARMHRALADRGVEADPARFALEAGRGETIAGRLAGRGLDDELRGSAFAIIEGFDGRTHHVALRDLDDASDANLGALVEARHTTWEGRRGRTFLQVRSDPDLAGQVRAEGATWLDRQLVAAKAALLGTGGFAEEVREALDARAEHLAGEGLARRAGRRWVFARDLLETLRARELASTADRLSTEHGLPRRPIGADGAVGGTYARRLDLASGRFAMLEDGLGFTLVPWRPELERHLGQRIEGVMTPGRGVAWSFMPQRALGR